ncbi:MAG: sigma-54-dependent Fis family transcriptional regulator [Planctomycetes bacterium]|nr:sigma-54-dependent Fis family transcriptional regulator [Planctomycetota bacterium]
MSEDSRMQILIVEDERNHADVLAELLERSGYRVRVADTFEDGKRMLESSAPDLVITDLDLGAHRGTELLGVAQALARPVEVMLISGVGSIEDAVEAMQLGAVHYFTKPLDVKEIRSVVGEAAERLRARSAGHEADAGRQEFEGIVGKSPGMVHVYDTIRRIAPTKATVLIQGENGTGKELVAKAIHTLSPRAKEPFVALNCAALGGDGLLDSELFGHERGAFTGAAAAREGKFEYANGGTLFLDEVGDMPLSLQVKLLRVIQEREIVRLGSNKTVKVDVRLLCATNKDLEAEIQEGRFREDLYYRIKVVSVDLPPLRQRSEDIPLLVAAFLREFGAIHGINSVEGRALDGITGEALAILTAQHWKGNVRELRNVVETMMVLSRGERLGVEDLPGEIEHRPPSPSTALVSVDDLATYTLDQWEEELIRLQLDRHEGNRGKVAKALGISERTLYRKLKEYGLTEWGRG